MTNPIEDVRAVLDGGNRWIKGQSEDRQGNLCLLGAMGVCVDSPEREQAEVLLAETIIEQYRDRIPTELMMNRAALALTPHQFHASVIAWFNDHADTEWSDIEVVTDKGAARWDDRV